MSGHASQGWRQRSPCGSRMARRGCVRTRAAGQCGQSLVLGMLLLGVLAIAFTRFFAVGQVAAARARQLHALDAAAYSGALVQARALNMMALINRSQVAHQVAMAHLITLASWQAYGATQGGRVRRGNPPAYLIGMMFGPQHGMAYRAAGHAANFTGSGALAGTFIQHDATVHGLLAGAQRAIAQTLSAVRRQAMQEVLAANYPHHAPGSFDFVIHADTLAGYLQARPATHSGMASMRNLVLQAASAYGFLAPRDHTARNPWLVHPACPHLRHELRRRSHTRLDRNGRWQANDTQSFHALRFNRYRWCYHREYPMGWAWTTSGGTWLSGGDVVRRVSGDRLISHEVSEFIAKRIVGGISLGDGNIFAGLRARLAVSRWPARGMPGYVDIAEARRTHTLRFAVALRLAGPEGLSMRVHSAAETFFDRPVARSDGRSERAHLFQPYWQARLAPQPGGRPRGPAGRRPIPRWRRRSAASARRYSGAQSGQALAEGMVVLAALLVFWFAIGWLYRLQGDALEAQHHSRYLAFLLTRHPGRAATHEGKLRLPGTAQPGAGSAGTRALLRQWQDDPVGILVVRRYVGTGIRTPQALSRHIAILAGAGHASHDAAAQRMLLRSQAAWRAVAHSSIQSASSAARRLARIDQGWLRPGPVFDWVTPWAGRVPQHMTQRLAAAEHAGTARYSSASGAAHHAK